MKVCQALFVFAREGRGFGRIVIIPLKGNTFKVLKRKKN